MRNTISYWEATRRLLFSHFWWCPRFNRAGQNDHRNSWNSKGRC